MQQLENERIGLYMLAGVATAPHFMERFYEELVQLFWREAEVIAGGGQVFPYGDWSRPLRRQAAEVWHDMRLPLDRLAFSRGGRETVRQLGQLQAADNRRLLLVGHSGGGVAALHAAAWWLGHGQHSGRILAPDGESQGIPAKEVRVVQIGSPKSPVPELLQEATLYCYSSWPSGKGKDPVCRLGTWKVRSPRNFIKPVTVPADYKPGLIKALPLAGGHPDYFRAGMISPDGCSNLENTLGAVWAYVKEWVSGESKDRP